MSSARYATLQRIFAQACRLPHAQRSAFLEDACASEPEQRAEIDALLAADDEPNAALDAEAGGAELLAEALAAEGDFATAASRPPDYIGSYRIMRVIAQGGMGIVYEAEQDNPRRRVALKVVRPSLVTDELIGRFRREARLLGRLRHPGIAQIYDANTSDSGEGQQPFLAMELVEGERIDEYARSHELDVPARLELIARLCDSLHYAHQKGVLHRDLKPANVLVTSETMTPASSSGSDLAVLPQPKVLDFGVARALDPDLGAVTLQTTEGQLVGTVPYMSPEQAAGDPEGVDARSDVYAVGLIAYELLAGCLPYEVRGKRVHEAVRIIREDEPSSLGSVDRALRGDVETIVAKALEKDPERRYASAAELAADIRRHLADQPIEARAPSTLYQLRKFTRRNKALVGGAVATLVVAVAGTIVATSYALKATVRAAELERASYVAGLGAAAISIEQGEFVAAAQYLDDLPTEQRGWEYDHLRARLSRYFFQRRVPAPILAAPVFDREGRHMFAPMADATLGTWEARSGRLLHTRPLDLAKASESHVVLHGPAARVARISADGHIAISSLDGEEQARIESELGHPAYLAAWDSAGERLLWYQGTSAAWHVWDGTQSRVLDLGAMLTGEGRVATSGLEGSFSHAGDRIAISGWAARSWGEGLSADIQVWLLDAATGKLLARKPLDDIPLRIAFAPDDETLAVGLLYNDVYLLDARTLEIESTLVGHRDAVYSLAWNSSGSRLITTSKDGTVLVRNADLLGLSQPLALDATHDVRSTDGVLAGNPGKHRFAAIAPDGERVLIAGPRLQSFPLEDPCELRGHASYVYYLAFSPDGSLLASSGHKEPTVHVWDVSSSRPERQLPVTGHTSQTLVAFSEDGRRLIAQGVETRQWDVRSGEALPVSTLDDRQAGLLETLDRSTPARLTSPSIAVGPEGWRVAVCGKDGVVELFEATRSLNDGWRNRSDDAGEVSGELLADVPMGRFEGHLGEVLSAAFSPDGTRVATGGRDCTVRIWDAQTFEQLLVLRGHRQYVKDVVFSPDGTLLASASGDKTIRLWDTKPLHERRAMAQKR